VKLHPDIQRFPIDDKKMDPIYELCEGRLPILMHTGDHRFDFSNPNRMKPVLEKYPALTVIGAHFGGWSVWDEATASLCQFPNFYVDCSSSLYAMTPQKAKELILAYGTDRVLFGTDYPMWEIETELERFMAIDLTEREREDIFYHNAAKLFLIQ
jgi:predicted TIM-barrel fold metal-dependent hydrolase